MAAKKVYAVRRGKVIGILDSWDACREAVEGYPGAEYKSFKSLEEAKAYMEGTADTKGTAVQEDFQKEEIKPLREKSSPLACSVVIPIISRPCFCAYASKLLC